MQRVDNFEFFEPCHAHRIHVVILHQQHGHAVHFIGDCSLDFLGQLRWKVDPPPCGSSHIVPPRSSTIFLTQAKAMPVLSILSRGADV